MQKIARTQYLDVMFWLEPTTFGAGEGLVVLLADLIKGVANLDVVTRLHMAERHRPWLAEALRKNEVSTQDFKLITYKISPALVHTRLRPKLRLRLKLLLGAKKAARKFELLVVAVAGRANAVHLVGLGLLLCIAALPFIPILLVALVAAALLLAVRLVVARIAHATTLVQQHVIAIPKAVVPVLRTLLDWPRRLGRMARLSAYKVESARLATAIENRTDVERVFVPFCFSGAALENIRKPKIVVFPDITTLRFPTRFLGHFDSADVASYAQSVKQADSLICYSEEVANNHLRKYFSNELGDKPVHIIPQGFFPISDGSQGVAQKVKFVNRFPTWCAFLPDYDVREINYVVYPSVDRPHKNSLTLLRAIESLIRKRHMNIKYVTTSHYLSADAENFITQKRLFFDALYTPTLDQASLEVLIKNAQLVIHPSLAEGGDIFNFSRAVSAGVPALLADIPVTREMFDRWDISKDTYEPWLFDPFDAAGLADLIVRSIADRPAILASQQKVHEQLLKYDYQVMASRYYEVYTSTTKADAKKSGMTMSSVRQRKNAALGDRPPATAPAAQ